MKPEEALEGLRILLVDDDEFVRDAVVTFLEGGGCLVCAVASAELGLEEARRVDFDVILADYRLPGIDGVEFLIRLADEGVRSRKVLATARGSPRLFAAARLAGADECIDKPLTVEKLMDVMTRRPA